MSLALATLVSTAARIRPVYGIPASAAVGAPISADKDFSQIAASATRNYVLVSAAQTGVVSVYTPEHGLVPIEGAAAAPDIVVLSPRGSAAALWFSDGNQMQVVNGLPDAPTLRQVNASFLGSSPSAVALSDDGAWLAGVWSQGTYAFGPTGEINRLPVENISAIAFFHGTHDMAAAGPSGLQTLTGIEGFAAVTSLLTSDDASLQPVAVAVVSGNQTLLLADSSGSLTTVGVASGTATTSDCGCRPEGLFGMGPAAFRLTGLSGGAFKLFDTTLGEILFAPVALVESEGAAQ